MIDLQILQKHGLTEDNLKKWLAVDPLVLGKDANAPDDEKRRGMLINRIRSRLQQGMNRNLTDYKIFHALDKAWETPFRQVTPTLLQEFMDSDPNEESVYKAFQGWGLTHLITERPDPKAGGAMKKSLNLPTFFNIFVPLVRAYVTIRWAKIMNDRRLTPYLSYDPVDQTSVLRALCKALTDRVQIVSSQYGLYDVQKQAVLKMLHYSFCLQFPREEWHWEDQWKAADKVDVQLEHKKEDGKVASVGEDIKVTVREGLRYHLPHPSRTYYDMAHGAYTFNYDFGCDFAGYWRIERWRNVQDSNLWNKDKVSLGSTDLIGDNRLFFTSVYAGCTLQTMPVRAVQPKTPDGPVLAAAVGVGGSSMDREKELANQYYGTDHLDQGVLISEHWERLIPKDNGLGTYDCPVWFRFVVAGDNCTILYAAPVPYAPVTYYGYDADESRSKNASLSLEILPFQDHFSNMLTQILLTCKQNLANLTFIDEDQLSTGDSNQRQGARETIDQIKNLGEGYYRFLNIFGYSSKKAMRFNVGTKGVPDVVQSYNFPRGNVAEMTQVLRTILEILERVLVMSSQEIAQAASHELRVDEVRNIQQSTSSRLQFTATPVEIATDALKRQLYHGLMAYGDEDFWVHLPSDIPLAEPVLAELGFTVIKREERPEMDATVKSDDRYVKMRFKKKNLTAIPIWALVSSRDTQDRIDNSKTAAALGTILQGLLNNPITAQAIGSEQAIAFTNEICKLAGLPRDLKFRDMTPQGGSPQDQQAAEQEQQAAAQEQLKQVLDTVMKMVKGELSHDLKPIMDSIKQTTDATKMNSAQINLLFRALNLPVINPQNDSPNLPSNGASTTEANPRMAAPVGGPVVPPTLA